MEWEELAAVAKDLGMTKEETLKFFENAERQRKSEQERVREQHEMERERACDNTSGGVLQLSVTIGILYSYVLGRFLEWELLAMACFVGAILLFAASHFSIESPRWLLLGGRKFEALQALLKLRGPNFRVEDECAAIQQVFSRVPTPPFHVLMAFHVHFLQQFSGINMLIFYARAIFANAGVTVTAANSSVIIAALQVAATLAAVSVMDLVGRRRLLTISSMVCVFSMVSIGALHQVAGGGGNASTLMNSERMPVIFLGLYIIGYSIGLGPVVWILSAELVPCRNRGFYLGAATAFNWICALVVTWLFGVLRETYHYSGMGWFFSSLTFVGAMLVNYFLPETQGHSLEQILLRQFREREDTSIQSTRP
ncbi:facilitated trehalose transporter Tret1 [Rhipicephalus sanguineus]|uniref:facilitated trehalose transporter Tret1 n=1 Tax=Rhipicephalus sanguineus TaxID=34632 RepID=UPI0018953609|nr:facilitated trehalose transporter Tret1 [Rhipicephalus sanguineus]